MQQKYLLVFLLAIFQVTWIIWLVPWFSFGTSSKTESPPGDNWHRFFIRPDTSSSPKKLCQRTGLKSVTQISCLWKLDDVNDLDLNYNTHTHTRLTAFCPGLPRWASTRKVKPIWILLKQETVGGSGSGISWAIMQVCTSLQTDNHTSTPPLLCFLQAGCPSCRP